MRSRVAVQHGVYPVTEAAGQSAKQITDEAVRRRKALEAELELTRGRATSWAKGIGALLAAGLAFSLVKGRSDITDLSSGAGVIVGVLLLVAMGVAVVAVYFLFRAAYGRLRTVRPGTSDHELAVETMTDMRIGLWLAAGGTAMLVGAVGLTWYGPAVQGPQLQVVDSGGVSWCGDPVRTIGGVLTLKTEGQEIRVDLATAAQLRPVMSCPTS